MPSLSQAQKQATDFIAGLSVKQRGVLIGATVATIAVLALFAHMIATPDYKPLVTGMEMSDAQALGAQLAAKNVLYQISADGKTVSVPSDQVDSARMGLATDGMPRSGRLGFELFDKMNWGQTEFDEKVNYQRALEGELERSIQTLRDVDSVRVHLVLPTDSVFIDRERKAKASVIIKPRGSRLSDETQIAIARLVAGAVDKLSPEDVTVVDADTNRPLGGPRHSGFSADGSMEEQLSAELVQTLEPVVGPQHVRARVNVEYDPSTMEESDETYDPKSAVAVSEQKSEEQVGGGLEGGVPGTSSNVPGGGSDDSKTPAASSTKAAAANGAKPAADTAEAKPGADNRTRTVVDGGDGTQISKSESNTYAVNKVVRHTLQPAGRIRRITAALLVDDAVDVKQENGKRTETRRKRTPEELKQIEDLARAAIGVDAVRGDILTVQNLSFDQSPVEAPTKPTIMQKVRVTLDDWSSLVRYAAIILLFLLAYALLLRPLKKQLLTTFRELPASLSAKSQPASIADLDPGQDPRTLPAPQQRALTLKKQLLEKVTDEPQTASKLIQAWIHEEAK
ncbi:MAG: flagellar basal-body MS-ring/collar protein FliF [Terriglobales bacterium]